MPIADPEILIGLQHPLCLERIQFKGCATDLRQAVNVRSFESCESSPDVWPCADLAETSCCKATSPRVPSSRDNPSPTFLPTMLASTPI